MFGSLFKKKEKWMAPEIAGVTIGRAVSLDPISLKLIPTESLLEAPESTLIISAQGYCDLGEQSHLHRFYPDDDRFLFQIQGGDGCENARIDEVMLWYFVDVQYPSNAADWEEYKKRIRQPNFELSLGGKSYLFQRSWFDTSTNEEDPMTYWETIVDQRDGTGKRRVYQSAMLYSRLLPDKQEEMLLVNLEESESGEKSVAFMIGRPIQNHEFSV